MSDCPSPLPPAEYSEARKAFIEFVKALARRQARLDLMPRSSVNDNQTRKDDRGRA